MSGIRADHLRTYVIRPTLFLLGMGGDAAEELMLGTALQESNGGHALAQLGGGPARSIFQIEKVTHDDIVDRYLPQKKDAHLQYAVTALAIPGLDRFTQLPGNLLYACAIARLVYAAHSRDPLPPAGDTTAQAAYYKAHYNSASGAATVAQYVANWKAALQDNR